jgi:hypothetical protein
VALSFVSEIIQKFPVMESEAPVSPLVTYLDLCECWTDHRHGSIGMGWAPWVETCSPPWGLGELLSSHGCTPPWYTRVHDREN